MDHLACFVPGMLALGVVHGAVTGAKADKYKKLAADMTETCYQMYARQPTGTPSLYALCCPVVNMSSSQLDSENHFLHFFYAKSLPCRACTRICQLR